MKAKILRDSYFSVNLSFVAIILAIFGYSLFFGVSGRKHPLPSGSEILTGKPVVSTGLSRSFSALIRFNFNQARLYNRHGFRIFLFFLIQLAMRTGALIVCPRLENSTRNRIILFDILLSVVLFIILFQPFFISLVKTITGHS